MAEKKSGMNCTFQLGTKRLGTVFRKKNVRILGGTKLSAFLIIFHKTQVFLRSFLLKKILIVHEFFLTALENVYEKKISARFFQLDFIEQLVNLMLKNLNIEQTVFLPYKRYEGKRFLKNRPKSVELELRVRVHASDKSNPFQNIRAKGSLLQPLNSSWKNLCKGSYHLATIFHCHSLPNSKPSECISAKLSLPWFETGPTKEKSWISTKRRYMKTIGKSQKKNTSREKRIFTKLLHVSKFPRTS